MSRDYSQKYYSSKHHLPIACHIGLAEWLDDQLAPNKAERQHQKDLDLSLIAAIHQQRIDRVITLIDEGANVDSCLYTAFLPLNSAAAVGNIEITKLLLNKGANPTRFVIEFSGRHETALDRAIENGHEEVADILRNHIKEAKTAAKEATTDYIPELTAHAVSTSTTSGGASNEHPEGFPASLTGALPYDICD